MAVSSVPVPTPMNLLVLLKMKVENGQIWEVRYDNYLQFLSEIENRREIYKKTIKRK